MSQAMIVGGYANSRPGVRTYIAQLDGAANFERASLMPRGGSRKALVYNELSRVNSNAMSQVQPALDALKAQGLIESYDVNPLSNTVVYDVPEAKADAAWKAMNRLDGIGDIQRNREVKLIGLADAAAGQDILMTIEDPTPPPAPKVEWNVERVNSQKVWARGFRGQGVTVGIVDTGVDIAHPALAAKYRGTNADGTTTHDYNFFDAISKKAEAYDDHGHGTHVSGTVLGSTSDYALGVAPEAKFIASKILSKSGSGTLAGVMKGLEWMLAPTKSDGTGADPTKAPDIISNSWGTTNGKDTTFKKLMQAFLAAGIEPVFAAGNSGPRAGSVGSPGSYPEVISVGATDKNDKVASFSSRGPSPQKGADGSDRKPDISAPGHTIMSSVPGGGYKAMSGTSMATPAVSGVVALLLSKYKDLTHDEIVKAITTTARDIDTPGYDYNSGHGIIDAEAALAAADKIVADRKTPAPPALTGYWMSQS